MTSSRQTTPDRDGHPVTVNNPQPVSYEPTGEQIAGSTLTGVG